MNDFGMSNFAKGWFTMKKLLVALAIVVLGGSGIAYGEFIDTFGSYAVGSAVNGQGGWTESGGSTNYKIAAAGVGGTRGVDNGTTGSVQLNWTGHPFKWSSLAVGDKVVVRMDFQANGAGTFDDDRTGWAMADNTAFASAYNFATQLDQSDGGGHRIVTYWRTAYGGGTQIKLSLASFGGLIVANDWYRSELDVTKLTATSARVDVSLVHLDAAGNPTGTPITGFVADTSALGANSPDPKYFTGDASDTMYPMFKNYSAIPGNVDNAYFNIVPEPSTIALAASGLAGLALLALRRRK